ncbi:hypothetical protein EDI_131370 [Entamoeba dispar SAW760]|uniref:Uncharacterized protein n=1 Tax=Entamoeba dispar (strain ATCC PRA-260 / SAW760) TaxID=370354 RepID=B0E5B7_ENTDS|nr:uncharacterized protein EDI_131370 [Entamoeba dispar SAW760]EDR30281.1 hypothetical protein EDI_131370 [Entamoeba dispar SAW760]|eukprot:EDR30281.1 hypothetical protein EDI_131370 [Entamoeba dispar SAW760]
MFHRFFHQNLRDIKVIQKGTQFVNKRIISTKNEWYESCGWCEDAIFFQQGTKFLLFRNGFIQRYECQERGIIKKCVITDDNIICILHGCIEFKGSINGICKGCYSGIDTDGFTIFVCNSKGVFSLNRIDFSFKYIRHGNYLSIKIDRQRKKLYCVKLRSIDIFILKQNSSFVKYYLKCRFPLLFGVSLIDGERLIYSHYNQNESIHLYQMINRPTQSWCFGWYSFQYSISENNSYQIAFGRMIKTSFQSIEEIQILCNTTKPLDVQCIIKKGFIQNNVIFKVLTKNEIQEYSWSCPSYDIPFEYYNNFILTKQPSSSEIIQLFNKLSCPNEAALIITLRIIPSICLSLSEIVKSSFNELQQIETTIASIIKALKLLFPPSFDKDQTNKEKAFWEERYDYFIQLDKIQKSICLLKIYSGIKTSILLPQSFQYISLERLIDTDDCINQVQQFNNEIIHSTKNYSLLSLFNNCGELFSLYECVKEEVIINLKNNMSLTCFLFLMKTSFSVARIVVDILLEQSEYDLCNKLVVRLESTQLTEYHKIRTNECLTIQNELSNNDMIESKLLKVEMVDSSFTLEEREKELFNILCDLAMEKKSSYIEKLKGRVVLVGERISLQKKLIAEGHLTEDSQSILLPIHQLQSIKK